MFKAALMQKSTSLRAALGGKPINLTKLVPGYPFSGFTKNLGDNLSVKGETQLMSENS
jgi:hypothetical protein